MSGRVVLPTSSDWATADLDNGVLFVDGSYAELLYPDLWLGCVGAWTPALDAHAWDYSVHDNRGTSRVNVTHDGKGWGFIATGSTDGIRIDSPSAILNPTERISLSAWINPTAFGSTDGVLNQTRDTSWYLGLTNVTPFQGVDFRINSSASKTSASLLSANIWYHCCGTYDRVLLRNYINGEEQDTTSLTAAIGQDLGSQIGIGRRGDSNQTSKVFNGFIQDCRVYNVDLVPAQVQTLAIERNVAYMAKIMPRVFAAPAVAGVSHKRMLLGVGI